AIAAGFTTYIPIILAVGHTSKFMAISWLPWLMTVFVYTLRNPRLIGAAAFAILLAVELRAGHPQITYYAAWLLGLWWIVEGVAAFRRGDAGKFAASSGILALGTILAVLMVAQPYMAQLEYKQFSTRGGVTGASGGESTGLAWDYAMNWSQGISELLTLLVANLFGGGAPTYWGVKPFTEGPHYVGGISILLALVAVIGKRGSVVRALSIGAVVLALFSLGKNAAWLNRPLFDHFPIFSSFRAPEMWLHLVELCIAILAGLGAAFLVGSDEPARRKKSFFVAAGCVLGISMILTLGGASLFSFQRADEGAQAAMQLASRENVSPNDPAVQRAVSQYLTNVTEARRDLFTRDAVRTTLMLVLAAGLVFLYFRGKVKSWMMLTALALLVLVDLWGVGKRHLTGENYADGPLDTSIATYGFDRFILDRVAESGGPGHFRTLSLESSPTNWARPAFHYETSGGYNAAKLQVYQDFIDNIFFDPQTGLPTLIGVDLSATRFVISNRALSGFRPVFNDEGTGMAVLERVDPPQRTRFVGEYSVLPAGDATFAALLDEGFDPRTEAITAEDPRIESAPIDSSSTTVVELVTYSAHDVVWEVETDGPRLLVTSEVYYPAGWRAFVDDVEVPIIRTNHTFRSVAVPAGAHHVRMEFRPETHALSSWVAIASTVAVYGWLILYVVLVWVGKRKRQD
ncbi:MAG TPA: YfhO family protein, partial [Rhodothermales bacterium]